MKSLFLLSLLVLNENFLRDTRSFHSNDWACALDVNGKCVCVRGSEKGREKVRRIGSKKAKETEDQRGRKWEYERASEEAREGAREQKRKKNVGERGGKREREGERDLLFAMNERGVKLCAALRKSL